MNPKLVIIDVVENEIETFQFRDVTGLIDYLDTYLEDRKVNEVIVIIR